MSTPPVPKSLPDRPVALVTGAGRRIGRAISIELARRGWSLALHHRSSLQEAQDLSRELGALGASSVVLAADLSVEQEARQLALSVVQGMGRWDALINNASMFDYDDLESFSYDRLQSHLRVNTAAPVLLARELHRHLQQRPDARGCVVNLLDQKLWNPNPDYLSYTLSKAALESANTLLALALAPRVRVCGVAPGVTLVSGPMSEEGFAQAHAMTPLGKSSTPEDIAQAVAFLLHSPAVTGTTLLVDGGQHLAAQSRDVLFLTPSRTSGADPV